MARSPGALPKWSSSELTCLKKTLVKNSTEVERTGKNVKGKTAFVIIFSPSLSLSLFVSLLLIIPEKGRGHWLHIWLFPPSSCSLTSICLCLAMLPPFPDLQSNCLFLLFWLFVLHLTLINQSIPFSFLSHDSKRGRIAYSHVRGWKNWNGASERAGHSIYLPCKSY